MRGCASRPCTPHDVAEAYRLAVLDAEARGAYNVAADPLLDGERLATLLGRAGGPRARARSLRAGADLTWRARLQPTPAGGSTWASACPSWTSRAPAASSAGHRPAARRRRSRPPRRHARRRGFADAAPGPRHGRSRPPRRAAHRSRRPQPVAAVSRAHRPPARTPCRGRSERLGTSPRSPSSRHRRIHAANSPPRTAQRIGSPSCATTSPARLGLHRVARRKEERRQGRCCG